MMQIHGPSECLAAEDVTAYVNSPGFTVLQFGPIKFYLDDPQQCDWLIIAATEAKQLLIDNPAEPEDAEPAQAESDEPEPGTQAYADKYSSRTVQRELFGETPQDQPASPDAAEALTEEDRDEDGPCMMVGCGHDCDDHSLDLERGDRLYCQRCECRRYLSPAPGQVSA